MRRSTALSRSMLVGLLTAGCLISTFAYGDTTRGVAQARELLSVSDPDKLRNRSIPQLYRLSKDDRLAEFYKNVWRLNRPAYPELAWTALERPEVRIAFAQFWGQYLRNTSGDRQGIAETREYAERFLHDPNLGIRSDAVAFLGALGTENDLPRLVEICSTDALPVAVNAAYAIRILMRQDANKFLERCASAAQNAEVAKAVRSILGQPK